MLNSLNVAHTGLTAARVSVENISNNIANENTPGYKKRVVQLTEIEQMDSRFVGRGVNASSAYRVTSEYMYNKLTSENTKSSYYEKLTSMLDNVEMVFSETDDSGFSADLNRYFQSVENLRSNPNSLVYKDALKSQGTIIADSLSNLYTTIQKQQIEEKEELKINISKVNDIIKEIGDINEKIVKYDSANNDLLDKRDSLELELSNYVNISVDRRDGQYELKISGQTIISNNTNVREINLMEDSTNQIDKFNYKYFDNATKTSVIVDSLKNDYNPLTGVVTSKNLDNNDIVTYKLNSDIEVSVKIGETLKANWDNDLSTVDTEEVITKDNLTRALVFKINNNPDLNNYITAYNGDYSIDASGNKTIINESQDNYLRIESKFPGIENNFEGKVTIQKIDNTNSTLVQSREVIYKNEIESTTPETIVGIGIYDNPIELKGGKLKAQIENLSSDSTSNKFQTYLDKLDAFARTLADITSNYSIDSNGNYVYGEVASDSQNNTINSIGLFSGSSVKNFKFNSDLVSGLDQKKLDYLATIQWKSDLTYDGKAQGLSSENQSSLLDFYNSIKVSIASDNESVSYLQDTQDSVKQSIENSYNEMTKVDKDEEMLNLLTFQAAYTANAKIVTAIDEMIQTLLGLKK